MAEKKVKKKDNYELYSNDFPIFDQKRGRNVGYKYKNEDGLELKAGLDNTYKSGVPGSETMNSNNIKYMAGLAQALGDSKLFGELSMLPDKEPVGRVGIKHQNGPSSYQASIYNYDDNREDFKRRTALELKAKQELIDGLTLEGKLTGRQDGLADYMMALQYSKKF